MGDGIKVAAICIVGFLGMFLPLYLFADPLLSPYYGSIQAPAATVTRAQQTVEYTGVTREAVPIEAEETDITEPVILADEVVPDEPEPILNEPDPIEETEVYRYEPANETKDLFTAVSTAAMEVGTGRSETRLDGNTYIVDFWDTGIDGEVQGALGGSLQSSAYWFGVQVAYATLCDTVWDEIQNRGEDAHITVNLWDGDKDQLFFSISDDSQAIYDITKENTQAQEITQAQEDAPAQEVVYNGGGDGNADNFDTWYIPANQQTTDRYVLNNNPDSMKVHHPECPFAVKISPEHYATSNLTIAELEAQGYTRCKQKAENNWRWE